MDQQTIIQTIIAESGIDFAEIGLDINELIDNHSTVEELKKTTPPMVLSYTLVKPSLLAVQVSNRRTIPRKRQEDCSFFTPACLIAAFINFDECGFLD